MCCNGEKLLEVVQAEVKKAMEEAGLAGIPALMQGLEEKVIPMLSGRVDSLERGMEDLMAREPGQELEGLEELGACGGNCALEESMTSEDDSSEGTGGGNSSVELEEGPKVEPEKDKEMKALQVKKEVEETQAVKIKSVREVRKIIDEMKALFSSSDTRRRNIEVVSSRVFGSWASMDPGTRRSLGRGG